MLNINPKEAHQIIASLEGGVVPSRGIRHLLVGRRQEVDEILSTLERVKDGASDIRFWVGDFGSGKSFMLQTIDTFALEKDFVVSTVDLSPTRAFYASNGKARALYREIMNNLHIKTCQDRSCLEIVLQKWITRLREAWEPENGPLVFEILQAIERTFDTFKVPLMAYDFGKAVAAYAQGMLNEDREQKIQALRWLRAETDTKTEAKKTLGIGTIINDTNWFDALKTFDELVVKIGYAGLVVNFDELVNVYKLPRSQTRAAFVFKLWRDAKNDIRFLPGAFKLSGAGRPARRGTKGNRAGQHEPHRPGAQTVDTRGNLHAAGALAGSLQSALPLRCFRFLRAAAPLYGRTTQPAGRRRVFDAPRGHQGFSGAFGFETPKSGALV